MPRKGNSARQCANRDDAGTATNLAPPPTAVNNGPCRRQASIDTSITLGDNAASKPLQPAQLVMVERLQQLRRLLDCIWLRCSSLTGRALQLARQPALKAVQLDRAGPLPQAAWQCGGLVSWRRGSWSSRNPAGVMVNARQPADARPARPRPETGKRAHPGSRRDFDRDLPVVCAVADATIIGGQLPLASMIIFNVILTIVTSRNPAGGYGKALGACGSRAVIPSCRSSRPTSKLRRGSYGPARCGAAAAM